VNQSAEISQRRARRLLVLAALSAIVCFGSLGGYLGFQPLLSSIADLVTYSRVSFIGTGALLAVISAVSLLAGSTPQKKSGTRLGRLFPILSVALAVHLIAVVWFAVVAGFLISK